MVNLTNKQNPKSYVQQKGEFVTNLVKRLNYINELYAESSDPYKDIIGWEIDDITKLLKVLKKY